jgi:lipopolysaccharide/colanic/teichoic acid biosynthesis glycosyltransferase
MKIVVTGASGFIGRNLVPLLVKAGAEVLVVGREPERLGRLFPSLPACSYDDISQRAAKFDLLLHLAVANSDADVSFEEFRAVNVELTVKTVQAARQANIPRFVNVSSVHALDESNHSAYARTKREAADRLRDIQGIEILTLYLPLVHGDRWGGRLRFLNSLPLPLARALFSILSALKPTLHIGRLAQFVLESEGGRERELILTTGQHDNITYKAVKRTVDLAFAILVAVLFWWALLLIWALIRLQSPGPGIFAQQRVGRDGRPFVCYKFRTMKKGTVQAATNQVSADAVTKIGAFLRKTKLDELPQIWNILRNEVSLVGPRPCLPVQVELIEARRRRGVLRLKPGISGLAQINGIDMSVPEKLAEWDARYGALQSLLLDARIIIATALGRGQGDRVAAER